MTEAPCARCPSPILAGAPRFSELRVDRNGDVYGVEEFHPGCWTAELMPIRVRAKART